MLQYYTTFNFQTSEEKGQAPTATSLFPKDLTDCFQGFYYFPTLVPGNTLPNITLHSF